ncbi:MAG: carboxypeptidase regulatory-like domain-containing protein, partial [Anaerolineae bacterium]|nr:carboxypeptidase regulatory-like domain-containing protein [Anaerolineae bacterium]
VNGWDDREVTLRVPRAGFVYRVAQKRLLPPEEGRGRHLLFGRVLDAAGNGLQGVAVEMRWTGALPGTRFPVVRTGSDPSKPAGYYEFLVTPGEFSLRVVQGDWESQVAEGLQTANIPGYEGEAASYEVDFCLGPWAEPPAESAVQGSLPGAPEGAEVLLRMGAETWRARLSPEGNFRIGGLHAGTGVLEVVPLGILVRPVVLDGHNVFQFDFPVGSVVEGRLEGGEPGRLVVLHALTWGWARETRTDQEGRFRFLHLPAGEYRLVVGEVESDLIRLDGRNTVELPPLDLSALTCCALEGQVLDPARQPLPWVRILLRSQGGALRETRADAAGRFRFEGLEPGTYHLVAEGLGSLRREIRLAARERKHLVLTAPPAKPMDRYVLLGRAAAPGTWVNLLLALPLLLDQGVACGFRAEDAAQAARVFVLAGEEGVSAEEERVLLEAGCRVQRLGGDPFQTARALQALPEDLRAARAGARQAPGYGVRVEPCQAESGQAYWKAAWVRHLEPRENRGRHHLFVDAVDEAGRRVVGAEVCVRVDGETHLVTLTEEAGPLGVEVPMAQGQEYALEMVGLPSERVAGLHTDHPDEPVPGLPLGNARHHHSFAVRFCRATAAQPEAVREKRLSHYVLFGPPDQPQTRANLLMALGYLLRFAPTFGFSPDEAVHARLVTVVADEEAVPPAVEAHLRAAGCHVHRVAGRAREVEARLAELEEHGPPVPPGPDG